MLLGDDIRDRFIRNGSIIGALACGALTVADLVRGDQEGLFWNGWYFGSLVVALLIFVLARSRLGWALAAIQAPIVHLAFAEGSTAILAYFWVFPFPIVAFFVLGLRRGRVVAAIVWGLASGVIFIRSDSLGLADTAPDVVASLAVICLVGWAYERLRASYERELLRTSVTDELTGIANRRHFNESLAQELRRSERYARPMSLILFDLDDFKRINDVHGHPAGDQVLVELARVVQATLRDADIFSRLGGDEFAVIAPETPALGQGSLEAVVAAERIQEAVAAYEFECRERVTLSLGVTEYVDGDDSASIVKRADDALYLAKERGRNCVATKTPASENAPDSYLSRRPSLAPAE